MKAQQKFECEGGYTLIQELAYGHDIMIFDSNDNFVLHGSCTQKIETQEEAEEYAASCLKVWKEFYKRDKERCENG